MENMLQNKWLTLEDGDVDDLSGTVREAVFNGQHEVHVGTDSQQDKRHTQFVSVIVLVKPGKGGRAFYMKDTVPRIRSLRERLMREVFMSVMVGLELNQEIPATTGLTIHIDANPSLRFKSSKYVKELTSMVVGQGFKSLVKPASWVATHVADHAVKCNVIGR